MKRSLRLRLFIIILSPLILLASVIAIWRISVAHGTADELFDRTLMTTGLAVSKDVALLDGDAIRLQTQRILDEAAGGPIRYHVYGPDGVLVTGYAVPPTPILRGLPEDDAFIYFDGLYKGKVVRVLRLRDVTTIGGMTGLFTISVWQDLDVRGAFAWELALRSLLVIALLILAVALLVWFGVRYGLKPLTDLEDAISRRSSEDLNPIQRAVPIEAAGIVDRLNTLFGKVSATLDAQAAFISDAAHQLRNPIAGLRALGESIETAPNVEVARARARDLVGAAERASDLANKLLTLERARAERGGESLVPTDLTAVLERIVASFQAEAQAHGVILTLVTPEDPMVIPAEEVMLGEAVTNLIDNALVHGGPAMSRITVELTRSRAACHLSVRDDGRGVPEDKLPKIVRRFGQAQPGPGSGLGLAIAEAVAKRHEGKLRVSSKDCGFAVHLILPLG